MLQYQREDGIQCQAQKWEGFDESTPDRNTFDIINHLNAAGLEAKWVPAEQVCGEWATDEDGEYLFDEDENLVPLITPQHIEVGASKDKLQIGDYVVKRDGDTYVQEGKTFEAVWTHAISDNTDEWIWLPDGRLPYAKRNGYWMNLTDSDVVSHDGGVSYFRLSERPGYSPYGKVYQSVPAIGGN